MVSGDDDLFSVFRPRPLCDLSRSHLQMLLYIQRTKPSSSILPMIRMPRMLPVVSSTIQQLVELPTECTMAQSIAGPGKYCTRKIKCHPTSVSYPSRKSNAAVGTCKAPHSEAVLGSLERDKRCYRRQATTAFQTAALLFKNCNLIRSGALR